MAQRTNRILCRAGFLTFCLLPTALIGGWIVNERVIEGAPSPVEEAQARPLVEAELSRLLGLVVQIERVAYSQPGVTLLETVTIADPETGRRIAAIPALEMALTESGLMLVATRPEIDALGWRALWEALYDRVLRERGKKIMPLRLSARQAIVVSPSSRRSPTFRDVDIHLASGNAAIEFRLDGVEMANRARFKAVRDRQASPPRTRWELHTGEADLPCVLFVEHLPWLQWLGDECTYNGSLWAEEADDGWRGELTGRFQQVDLNRLITEQFPHKLSGVATATFSNLAFTGGRIRRASGWLEAGPGTVSRGFLGAAIETFDLRYTDPLPEAAAPLTRYGQFAVGFELDEAGVRLSGNCDPDGTILVLEDNPEARLLDRHTQVTPVVSLVRMLAPVSEVQVSATQETDALLRVLPLPPIKRPEPPADHTPEARVRLAPDR